jgi:hypothetical protein
VAVVVNDDDVEDDADVMVMPSTETTMTAMREHLMNVFAACFIV